MSPSYGDFGVVKTNGVAAWLIRFGTRSPVNHAFIYVGNGKIVEAQPGGAVISDADKYPAAIWSDLGLTHDAGFDAAYEALRMVGTPYSWIDIAALTLDALGLRFPWVDKRIERQDRLICSQLVDLALSRAGVHLFKDGRLTCEVTPGDLYDIIQKGGPA